MHSFSRFALVIIVVFELASRTSTLVKSAPREGNTRYLIFISDMHLGVGKNPDGSWHPYEDARWAPEFGAFLQDMDRRGEGHSDLILNGDTLELWQSLKNDCLYKNKNLSCTEEEALDRIRRVISEHQAELSAIGTFAKSGENHVVVVPGNHDAALLFDKVGTTFLASINAPPDKIRIAKEGYWVSSDHLIYAEHGQQIGEDPNKFDYWPKPFVLSDEDKKIHLLRPWGEQFVQRYYNKFEKKYPVVDNFSDEGAGIRYGFAAEGVTEGVADIGRFVKFMTVQLSWNQFGGILGPDKDGNPEWDIHEIRHNGDRFLVESVPSDDPLRGATDAALKAGTLGESVADLSLEEITEICNVRASIYKDQPQGRKTIQLCPVTNLGGVAQSLLSSRNKVFEKYLDGVYDQLGRTGIKDPAFQLFVYSHTHLEQFPGFHPMENSGRRWQPTVVNTGAWQRTLKREPLDTMIQTHQWVKKDVLRNIKLEDLPACYPVVLVQPYTNVPASFLWYWQGKGQTWSLEKSCN